MKNKGILWISLAILFFAFFTLWLRVPLSSSDIWMSPDETANAVAAINYSNNQQFGYFSELTQKNAWAHPRSFVYVAETNLVSPIGFLGMPFILAVFYKIFGILGINFLVPLLALITLYPLWRCMPQKWPKPAKVMALLVWMSLPTVILYANRGTFPQLTQLCLVIWTWWLITRPQIFSQKEALKNIGRFFNTISLPLAGAITALALAIRPPEAVWIIPVILFAFFERNSVSRDESVDERKTKYLKLIALFVVPLFLVLLFFAKLGADTYGKWFVSGYQIRPIEQVSDIPQQPSTSVTSDTVQTKTTKSDSVSFFETLPFSFHPRNIWWNFKNYYLWLLLPWTVFALGAVVILFKEKAWKSRNKYAVFALAWTSAVLIAFYGNGIYQDHVRLNEISLGNSFLRYTLPLSVVIALSCGFIFSRLWRHWSLKLFALCITVGLSAYGIWVANYAYDESLFYVEQELIAYRQVRTAALQDFPENGIVISDRSDKIFFPVLYAVSPMPETAKIIGLQQQGYPIRLYLPVQDIAGLTKWEEQGISLRPVFTSNNQVLYDLFLINRQ